MRVAAPCWPMLLGLSVATGQVLLIAVSTHGWELNALRAHSAEEGRASNMRVVGPANDTRVQQAAYASAPHRPAPAPTKGPMFRGFELRLPKMPFSRGGMEHEPEAQGTARHPYPIQQAATQQAATGVRFQPPATRATGRVAIPQPTEPSDRSTLQSARRTPVATPLQHAPNLSMAKTTSARAPAESAHKSIPTVVTEPRPLKVAPEASLPIVSMPEKNTETARSPQRQSPADRLIVEAHELSRRATTADDYTRIIETCRRVKASQPNEPLARYASELAGWALNRRGQLKADAGQLREAMLDFDDAIRSDPNCWRAVHNRGVLLAQSGEFEKAFDDFNRTIHVNDEFAKAYSNRAALYVVAGDLLPAMSDYKRAIELEPNFAIAHRGRGRVCHLLGRLDESIGHYDAAVQLAPDDAYAIASRADLLTDLGRYAEAVRDYERSIELDARSPEAYRGLAWLMATCPDDSVRNPARAVELAEFALRLDEEQEPVGLDTLAAAQASTGDFAAAMQTLHKAIETAPEAERSVYQDRLMMYQHARPFRIAPVREVTQANYEQ